MLSIAVQFESIYVYLYSKFVQKISSIEVSILAVTNCLIESILPLVLHNPKPFYGSEKENYPMKIVFMKFVFSIWKLKLK